MGQQFCGQRIGQVQVIGDQKDLFPVQQPSNRS